MDTHAKRTSCAGVSQRLMLDRSTDPPLPESEDRFRVSFEQAAVGMAHVALEGRWLLANDRLCQITGYRREELLSKTFQEITWQEDLDHDLAQVARLLDGEISHYSIDKRYIRPDGSPVWVHLTVALYRDCLGQPVYFHVVVQDISDRKATENALRRNERRLLEAEAELRALNETLEHRVAERSREAEERAAQLRALASALAQAEQSERRRLAQMLHDGLQQLLVATKMRLALLRRNPDPKVAQAADRANELLDESISQSRSLTAQLSPPVLYDAGLAGGLEWLARHMQEKHLLSVKVHVGEFAEPADEGMRVFLFQAARELLFNIVKHAETNSACVELRRFGESRVQLIVSDAGGGFDPAACRAQTTCGGFGLFSIRERLQLIDGRLDVRAAPGEGTRVTIEVPAGSLAAPLPANGSGVPASAAHLAEPVRSGDSRCSGHKIRVILADDHAIVRQGLAGLLREHPEIEVVGEASDGEEALHVARQTGAQVVVMDLSMPGMNGIDATRAMRESLPDVRIIGLSMHEEADLGRAMRAAGAVRYLRKDTACDELISTILAQRVGAAEA